MKTNGADIKEGDLTWHPNMSILNSFVLVRWRTDKPGLSGEAVAVLKPKKSKR